VTPARSVLVIGGQRSGKSRTAEDLALRTGLAPIYLATATAGDAEMAERITRHRSRRGDAWTLVEEPLDLPAALKRAARADAVVLVDCLTLWVSNLMGEGRPVTPAADRLLASLAELSGPAVLVSNEVGAGIVPDNPLARRFADELGVLNQRVAGLVSEVILTVAGLPIHLKRSSD
jgi:adenosylcobinamide kinase / adenosylcobinamide-phosphate guanylyltransferase